jgi:hypothetical protein
MLTRPSPSFIKMGVLIPKFCSKGEFEFKFWSLRKIFLFLLFLCVMRLRGCVCYMLKFGVWAGRATKTQTRRLFFVMLRWCLSDHGYKRQRQLATHNHNPRSALLPSLLDT